MSASPLIDLTFNLAKALLQIGTVFPEITISCVPGTPNVWFHNEGQPDDPGFQLTLNQMGKARDVLLDVAQYCERSGLSYSEALCKPTATQLRAARALDYLRAQSDAFIFYGTFKRPYGEAMSEQEDLARVTVVQRGQIIPEAFIFDCTLRQELERQELLKEVATAAPAAHRLRDRL